MQTSFLRHLQRWSHRCVGGPAGLSVGRVRKTGGLCVGITHFKQKVIMSQFCYLLFG